MSIKQGSRVIAGSGGGGIANYDGKSITENANEEIQTVGVISARDNTTAIKIYPCTKAQYDAIVTKDPNTLYNITDDVDEIVITRTLGQIVQSTIPLVDAGLHLLDGSVISYGMYKGFVNYIDGLYSDNPNASYFAQTRDVVTGYNINAVGSIANNRGSLTGFSSSNYAQGNKTISLGTSDFEFIFKVTTGSSFSSANYVFSGDSTQFIVFCLNTSRKLLINIGTGSSWVSGDLTGSTTFSTNTDYYFRLKRESGVFTASYSTDKQNWNTEITYTGSVNIANFTLDIGVARSHSEPWTGSIDLNESYLYVNNSLYWAGATRTTLTPEQNWQASVTNYGECEKFVYDSVNKTVRLPKRTSEHGALIKSYSSGTDWYRIYADGWCEQGGSNFEQSVPNRVTITLLKPYKDLNYCVSFGERQSYQGTGSWPTGYFNKTTSSFTHQGSGSDSSIANSFDWYTSGYTDISDLQKSPIYEYICIATYPKTQIEVDIDEIATDLNGKADTDLSNMNPSQTVKNTIIRWLIPDYANGQQLTGNTFTSPSIGFVTIQTAGGTSGIIYVNGNPVGIASNSSADSSVQFYVDSGDVITLRSGYTFAGNAGSYFYPLKGANQ